jgi:adenylate kinase
MRLVLVGPPGCGKGTQANLVSSELKIPQVSTGDILRAAVREGTELGSKARGYMDEGQLLPDELIIDLMSERISESDCSNGYILDGFPRTVRQAEGLDKLLSDNAQSLDAVISIEVSDDEVVGRLAGRRQCKMCGDGYHLEFKKPATENCCDKCGGSLYLRDDDREDTIRARLEVYRKQTEPLLAFYKETGLLKSAKGVGTIEEIFKRVSSLINEISPQ